LLHTATFHFVLLTEICLSHLIQTFSAAGY